MKISQKLIILNITIVIIISILFNLYYYSNIKNPDLAKNTLVLNKDEASPGYTLLTSMGWEDFKNFGDIYLVDLNGKPVHKWKTKYPPFYSILKKNGNLVTALIDPNKEFQTAGSHGIIQELDWDSKVLWEYKNENLKLDFDVMPNGNILAIIRETVPPNISKKILGGFPDNYQGLIYSEAIIEINKSGKIVWMWQEYEHLNPEKYPIGPLTPKNSWTHTNSVKYVKKDPITNQEAILISLRNINKVFMINKNTKNIIWESPSSLVSQQHDATLTDKGNILIFDNNMFKEPSMMEFGKQYGSRVIEVDPKTNEIVWEFNGGKLVLEKTRFIAALTSGAQRLDNGNTLIINGPQGYLFEVNKKNNIVWELINPYSPYSTGPWPHNAIFKARKYLEKEINWPIKLSPSLQNKQ